MKRKRLTIALLGIMWFASSAAAYEITGTMTKDLDPIVSIERDDTGVTVDYTFPGAFRAEDDLYPGTWTLAIPGFGSNRTPGEAAWLMRWDTFEIPDGCGASVQTLASETTVLPIKLAPARQDLINSSDEVYSLENVLPIAEYSGWLPQECVEIGPVKVFRDRNILYVGVRPISYSMSEGNVRAVEHMSYRVSFTQCASTLFELNKGETVVDTQKVMLK